MCARVCVCVCVWGGRAAGEEASLEFRHIYTKNDYKMSAR